MEKPSRSDAPAARDLSVTDPRQYSDCKFNSGELCLCFAVCASACGAPFMQRGNMGLLSGERVENVHIVLARDADAPPPPSLPYPLSVEC
mmetsp:Transcript_65999/g.110132  ORF Transcript_65999/g.110132 Transcript_65999/m.110132 type:complete len:90 (+) Transcript_65999:660-929(+)